MLPGQVPESSLHTVSRDGVADGFSDREPDLCRRRGCSCVHPEVDHEGRGPGSSPLAHRAAEAVSGGEAVDSGEHGGCRGLWPSDGQALAALAATARQDGATGAGPHAQAEAVHLVTATVVRLVRTLAHGYFSEGFEGCPLHTVSVLAHRSGTSAGTAHPRGRQVADRGHAAPVDRERPANGTRRANGGSNPRGALDRRPVDDVLLAALLRCYVRRLRGPSRPRSDQGPARCVIRVTGSRNRPLTCGNAGRIAGRHGSGAPIPGIGAGSSQLVDNSVEASSAPSVT